MSPRTFLVELGTEELPANAIDGVLAQAGPIVERLLSERRLAPSSVTVHAAPRRIAVVAAGVPEAQAAERLEHRGPPEGVAVGEDGVPTKAGEGFARRHGLAFDALERRDGFVWAVVDAAAAPAASVLPEVVKGLVAGLSFPRSMRWGTERLRFARPIRWIVALHGPDVVPVEIAGVAAGRASRGHRFLAPAPIALADPEAYLDALRAGFVVADPQERRRRIAEGLDATDAGWSDPGGVLDEVVHLAEWPTVLRGTFDERFLELPDRVLVVAMQSHQRYLPLAAPDGSRRNGFLFVANGSEAAAATIVRGNERVLFGRLDDAVFSFRKDLERGLDAMAAELERITFHARAGSLADKTARIAALVERLADAAGATEADRAHALAAARLAKADQASVMVGEFAELEGYAGAVYARREGRPEAVAVAIGEHFRPDQAGGALPETLPGALVAAADKLDNLVTAFAIGEIPTGSRDPYGLRRSAAGVAAIALARGWRLSLDDLVGGDLALLARQGADVSRSAAEVVADVRAFVLDRVDATLEAEGLPGDVVRAARGAEGDDPLAHVALARALAAAGTDGELDQARTALERCRRLAARSAGDAAPELDPAALSEPAEQELLTGLRAAAPELREAAAALDYPRALARAAALAPAIDRFFEDVLVMAEDPHVRANRLRLLVDVTEATRPLGDLSALQR